MIPSTMASPNGTSTTRDVAENSLEKIKRQLASASGKCLLQGPLLKRSETLRKWNERWVILDPTTGRMEYKVRRNEPSVKGTITFDADSTITVSPVNFHGLPKYDGCCFYIGIPSKKDYFFCAETPGAARAWVSTLQATQLVLRAHKEAVNSLSGNGSTKLGTVAAAVAAANSIALECSKEIEAAMQVSMRNAFGVLSSRSIDGPMDDFSIMKETLRVKDEELQNLARDLRARDSTINDIADKLSETAEAAEAAASAVHLMDEQRRKVTKEFEHLTKVYEKQIESLKQKLKDLEEKVVDLTGETDQMVKQRDSALQEAHLWRSELAKARDRAVILEAAVLRAEEKARVAEAVDAESRKKELTEKETAAANNKQELVSYVNALQAQLQRHHVDPKHIIEEKSESCSNSRESLPLTKHVDFSDENIDKARFSLTKSIPVSEETVIHLPVDHLSPLPSRYGDWHDIRATESSIEDVREISQETGGSNMDILGVIHPPPHSHH